ncbi:MAG: ribonuclease P protein component [Firmicutes bacterium]|nr:ribonuclease P protein component [Bacillota bacterium]MCM1400561.1 ribonuclease P protein component [Bacteroides sp.]MCM1476465.1 ribonuclease P protein component [Bacteroides sp.]
MTTLRLYKKEKLCSLTAIERLFATRTAKCSCMAYPWRAVWHFRNDDDSRRADCPQFIITVPKRKLRHAVDRVRMRRLMREAYRLNRHLIPQDCRRVDIAFIYVAPKLTDYDLTVRSLEKILDRLARSHSEP